MEIPEVKEIQYLAARDGDGIESERCGCGDG